MIYLKRFCFVIICILCILIGIIGTLIELIIYPIWCLIYYVITGEDTLNTDLSIIWEYSIKFLDWYKNKFGPVA